MICVATLRRLTDRPRWLLWGYLLLLTTAELLTSLVNLQLGMILHVLLLIALSLHSAVGRLEAERRLVLALMLAPLIRLLSLSLPLFDFPQLLWYPMVSVPLLAATWIVVRQLHVSRETLGLRTGNLVLQLLLAGGGLGLGAIQYAILQPSPLITTLSWAAIWLPALNLVVFTGFTEELIFRGLLQVLGLPVLGRWALIYVSLSSAALHIGFLSVLDVVFVFGVGLLFAYIVRWSGSILGVALAHGLTNVMLFLFMPYLAQHPSDAVAEIAPWVIGGGTAIAISAIGILMVRARGAPDAARSRAPLVINRRSAMNINRISQLLKPNSSEAVHHAHPTEIERISARYSADPRTLSEESSRFYTVQLSAKDKQIAELTRRAEAAEQERDALAAQLHELKRTSARYIANPRTLSEGLSRRMEAADHESESRSLKTEMGIMSTGKKTHADSSEPQSEPDPTELLQQVTRTEIDHLIERASASDMADLRALRDGLRRRRR